MGAGKILSIISGVLLLAATFLLDLGTSVADNYVYGVGIVNIAELFGAGGDTIVSNLGAADWVKYIIAIGVILFIASGVFLLIGAKSRVFSILGSLLPILLGLSLLLIAVDVDVGFFNDVSTVASEALLTDTAIVAGTLPYYLEISTIGTLAGLIILVAGVLGLVSGILSREDF
jgi:hypothetical protein